MKFPKDFEFVCVTEWDEDLYLEALSWVDETKRVAILSSEERESRDPRVKIYLFETPLQEEVVAKQIGWSAVFKKLHIIGSGAIRLGIEKYHLAAHSILSEAADYWVGAMKNARANEAHQYRGMDLKGTFANIPAIIVGAGPSLEKNGHLLKEFEERALIFAGGSALNTIDIEPHLGASIDPIAPYRQFKAQPFSQIPFCYQSRMNPDNFSLLHGEKILFPDSSVPAINWIEGQEMFDGGWTVGNFLTQVAQLMGCSPILFIGMDLCYENGRKYAKMETDLPDGLIEVRGVLTQKDWLMAAEWTEKQNGKMFDMSSGMLRLPKISIDEALALCEKKENLRSQLHEKIQKLPKNEGGRWGEWDTSLSRCKNNFAEIEREVVYQKLLMPLWQIWRPVFEREIDHRNLMLHQKLFFQKVIEEHETFVLPKR